MTMAFGAEDAPSRTTGSRAPEILRMFVCSSSAANTSAAVASGRMEILQSLFPSLKSMSPPAAGRARTTAAQTAASIPRWLLFSNVSIPSLSGFFKYMFSLGGCQVGLGAPGSPWKTMVGFRDL